MNQDRTAAVKKAELAEVAKVTDTEKARQEMRHVRCNRKQSIAK